MTNAPRLVDGSRSSHDRRREAVGDFRHVRSWARSRCLLGQLSGIAAVSGFYGLDLGADSERQPQDGGAIVLFICVSAPVQVALLVIAAGYKGNAAAYLGYKLPRRSEVVFGIAALVALILVGDAVSWLAGRNIVDPFQSDIYQAAQKRQPASLLLVAITVFIPITEESLFRGFLFRGWLRSPRRAWPVIVLYRRTVRHHSRSIRLVSDRPGVCFWCLVRMDAVGHRAPPF